MKIHANVAVISLFVTLLLLFGGFFGYQWYFVQRPLESLIASTPHVTDKKIELQPTQVKIEIVTDQPFSLTSDYPTLREQIEERIGKRKLEFKLVDKPSKEMETAWNQMAFGVKEGIAQKHYTQIPKTVQEVADPMQIQYDVKMDDQYVYIKLYKEDRFMYQVLPLHDSASEVKANG